MREAENRLFRMTALWWVTLFVVCMSVMLYVATHKELASAKGAETAQTQAAETTRAYRMCVVLDPLVNQAQDTSAEAQDADAAEAKEQADEADADVALSVAINVAALLADSEIRVCLTRTDSAALPVEECLALAERKEADYYICLDVSTSPKTEAYGISGYYNTEYFIPQFGNVELADLLVRSVTLSASDRAVGLYAAEEGSVLWELQIPSAQVNLGYETNEAEGRLLAQDAYQEKLAQGIADALQGLLEQTETEETK